MSILTRTNHVIAGMIVWMFNPLIGPIVFVELFAGWFQHRDISTPQLALVGKGRAKGAIFPLVDGERTHLLLGKTLENTHL